MRRRRVVWARAALDELKEAAAHVALENPAAARRVAIAIRAAGRSLGVAATGRPGRVSGTYEKPLRRLPYLIAYTIQLLPDGEEAVIVLHIVHGARDWPDEAWPA